MSGQADLARRLVAFKHFRWMVGMRERGGYTYLGMIDGRFRWANRGVDSVISDSAGALPDLADPATLGCLLALVREAYDDEDLGCHPMCVPFRGWEWYSRDKESTAPTGGDGTYAEALVAALQAAP